MAYTTKIITTIDDVPADHVSPAVFRELFPHVSPVAIQKAISDAHMDGHVRACKLVRTLGELKNGRVFVHKGDTVAFLDGRYGTKDEGPQCDEVVVKEIAAPAPAPVVDAVSAADLLFAIRRLTVAVHDLSAAMALKSEAVCEEAYHTNGFAG
jgi:hypothetical protein